MTSLHFLLTLMDFPDPGIGPGSNALQVDALPSEPQGSPILWVAVGKFSCGRSLAPGLTSSLPLTHARSPAHPTQRGFSSGAQQGIAFSD